MSYTSEYRIPTPAERHQIMIEARRLQSQAFADIFRGIGRVVSGFFANAVAMRRRAVLLQELSLLTDRELADMGLSRGDFASIVAGTYTRESAAPVAPAAIVRTAPAAVSKPANDAAQEERRIAA